MNILIVDDHQLVIQGMTSILSQLIPEANFYEATNGYEAHARMHEVKPDVILLDVNMPQLNGLETTRLILGDYPHAKIIIVTAVDGKTMILSLFSAGIKGFVFKHARILEIETCIRTVMNGEQYFCKEVNEIIATNIHLVRDLLVVDLEVIERQMIWLLHIGYSTKEVSSELGIKEKIITNIRERLIKKTKTKNATGLVAYAFLNALVGPSDDPRPHRGKTH